MDGSESDTRCRSKTESGDSRSICGKLLQIARSGYGQEGSIVDSSINNTGRPSRTGYTRWHAVHFKLSGSDFNSRSFLHAGQTIRSRRSWGIMGKDCTTIKKHFHHGDTGTKEGILRFWIFDFRLQIGWKISRSLHTKPAYLGMNAGFCPWSFSVVCLSPW